MSITISCYVPVQHCRTDADDALCCQPPVAGRAGGGQGRARGRTPAPAQLETLYSAAAINLNILNFSSSASSHNSAHSGAADSFPRVQSSAAPHSSLPASPAQCRPSAYFSSELAMQIFCCLPPGPGISTHTAHTQCHARPRHRLHLCLRDSMCWSPCNMWC